MPGFVGIVEKLDDGRFRLLMNEVERDVVSGVCCELREILRADPGSTTTWRLFPPAYTDDADQERFYQQMTRDGLVDSRIQALTLVESTAHKDTLDGAELDEWMAAVNSVRLTLGTVLGITDDRNDTDPDDPNVNTWAIYEFLSFLLMSIVHVLNDD